jgi:hypothetical protein
MSTDDKPTLRGPVATVIATAAATIAIGVTTAALAGYLVPERDRDAMIAAQPSEPAVTEAPPASPALAPSVVLVPVAPDVRGGPSDAVPTPPVEEPRVVFAADFETGEDGDDDHHHRKHHERGDEDDNDRDD